MTDKDTEIEIESKKKLPIVKIIVIVLLVLILLIGTVVSTLFFAGAFDAKDVKTTEEQLASLEEQASTGRSGDIAESRTSRADPSRVRQASPQMTRFVQTYKEIEREYLANLSSSRKVIQVQIAVMTTYDDRVFKNVDKHEFALRSATLDVLRQVTDQELETPSFRKDLSEKIRLEMNSVLERYEDFGGIDEVYFTTFVVQ